MAGKNNLGAHIQEAGKRKRKPTYVKYQDTSEPPNLLGDLLAAQRPEPERSPLEQLKITLDELAVKKSKGAPKPKALIELIKCLLHSSESKASLIELLKNYNHRLKEYLTLMACIFIFPELLDLCLTELGVSANYLEDNELGQSLLMYTISESQNLFSVQACVNLLIKHGAEINFQRSIDKRTALSLAAGRGSLAMISLLMAYGADPSIESSSWTTAEQYLSRRSQHFANQAEAISTLQESPETEANACALALQHPLPDPDASRLAVSYLFFPAPKPKAPADFAVDDKSISGPGNN